MDLKMTDICLIWHQIFAKLDVQTFISFPLTVIFLAKKKQIKNAIIGISRQRVNTERFQARDGELVLRLWRFQILLRLENIDIAHNHADVNPAVNQSWANI